MSAVLKLDAATSTAAGRPEPVMLADAMAKALVQARELGLLDIGGER
jgi:hypothetical protein